MVKKILFCFAILVVSALSVLAETWIPYVSIIPRPPYVDEYTYSKYGGSWYVKDRYIDKSSLYSNGEGIYMYEDKIIYDDGSYCITTTLINIRTKQTQYRKSKYYTADGVLTKSYGGESWRNVPPLCQAEWVYNCVKKLILKK